MQAPPPTSSHINCQICGDAGVVHPLKVDGKPDYSKVVTCRCQDEILKARRMDMILKFCTLPARSERSTFETFNALTPDLKAVKEMCLRLARGDEDVVFLTLLSDTGKGKSHLSIAICREWLSRGLPAKYCYVPEILDEIRDSYDDGAERSHNQLLKILGEVSLLVLDDLGTEKKSAWASETLQTIIDNRSRNALPLVITTNKSLDLLPNDDEGRISSRLKREKWCHIVSF